MLKISSVERAFQVLEQLNEKPLSFSEIHTKLGLPKSTAWNLLKEMEKVGAIEKKVESGKYHLGFLMLRIGLTLADQNDLKSLAQPIVERLAQESEEIGALSILDKNHFRAIRIAKAEGRSSVHFKVNLGAINPCHSTSSGKLLLAYLSEREIDSYFEENSLKRFTENTITDQGQLIEELQNIKTNNYAIEREEHVKYSIAISAPVRNRSGQVIAAMTVSGLINRMEKKIHDFIPLVQNAADELSLLLGYELPLR